MKNNYTIYETKINYSNRTWESFTYESILLKIILFRSGGSAPQGGHEPLHLPVWLYNNNDLILYFL